MSDIFISPIPFGVTSDKPLKLIETSSLSYKINHFGRKITEEELVDNIKDVKGLIAGTEPITKKVLDSAINLKVISRLGVGTDNIDMDYAKSKNIKIEISNSGLYNSVAEFTIGLMINSLRGISFSNMDMRKGIWNKTIGKDISESIIGIVGAGNIGRKVINLVSIFKPKKILVFDPFLDKSINGTELVELKELMESSDLISLHLPLNDNTKHMISKKELGFMNNESILINTSRSDIVNQEDLYSALKQKSIGGAALDVFSVEPYFGQLSELDNCFLTPHIAPMTRQSREAMEFEAVENCVKAILANQ